MINPINAIEIGANRSMSLIFGTIIFTQKLIPPPIYVYVNITIQMFQSSFFSSSMSYVNEIILINLHNYNHKAKISKNIVGMSH